MSDGTPIDDNSAAPRVGRKVKSVLDTLSDHGNQHLIEVECDLEQTVFLMSTAIEKLGASFIALHANVLLQQETVNFLLAGGEPTQEIKDKFAENHASIESHVFAAVTGLQFHDLTSQLIFRTVKRVTGFREMLSSMEKSGGADRLPNCEINEIVMLLGEINKSIEEQSKTLDKTLAKAVSQTHMESGDIELF